VILGNYANLEERQSRSDMAVILNTLAEQGQMLNLSAMTLGANDDTYEFLVKNSSMAINSSLADLKMEELRVNFVILYNRTGDIFYDKGYDLVTLKETEVPEIVLYTVSGEDIYSLLSIENVTSGVIRINAIPVYLAATPIIPQNMAGVSRGTLVLGRYIDEPYIEKLSEITNLPIYLALAGEPAFTPDMEVADNYLKQTPSSAIYVQPLGADIIASYAKIPDITNKPGFILKTERSRDIYTSGVATVGFFIFLIITLLGVFLFTGIRLINNTFTQIDRNIEQFAILGDHIRNPLTVIVALADLHDSDISQEIIEQARIINDIINQLDVGWIESEKVKEFLRRYTKR
jgi:sensor domain CHASE-containing protein